MSILGLIGDRRVVVGPVAKVWNTGTASVITLTTRTGKALSATTNQAILTDTGWRRMGELKGTELVATPRRLPPHGIEMMDRFDRCRLLGYFAGNGSCLKHRSVGLIIPDDTSFADAVSIVHRHWPEITMNEQANGYHDARFSRIYENGYGKPFGNPLREWLRAIGFFGDRDFEKHVPDWVFEAGAGGAAHFLSGYLATDGCVKQTMQRRSVHFDTTSPRLATDVQALLLRLGVIATISKPTMGARSTRPIVRISLCASAGNLRRFADQVQTFGYRGLRLREMISALPSGRCNSYVEGLPPAVSTYASSISTRKDQHKRMRRSEGANLATTTLDPVLSHWSDSDLMWEDIRAIEPAGEQEVWDVAVPAVDTYLANGIVGHCSCAMA